MVMLKMMRRFRANQILVSFLVMHGLLSSWAYAEETDCGRYNVKVEFTSQIDAAIACEGIRRALSFFETYGYAEFHLVHVKMLDLVISESLTEYDGEKELKSYCAIFIGDDGHSEVASWEAAKTQKRKVFGSMPDTPEFHSSIVAHEVAHDLYNQIYKSMGKNVERPLTEFVSYVVQIETMRDEERTQVLNLWPNKRFETALEINSLTWATAPNMFGSMSYRFHRDNPDFIKSILEGRIRSGDDLLPYR